MKHKIRKVNTFLILDSLQFQIFTDAFQPSLKSAAVRNPAQLLIFLRVQSRENTQTKKRKKMDYCAEAGVSGSWRIKDDVAINNRVAGRWELPSTLMPSG